MLALFQCPGAALEAVHLWPLGSRQPGEEGAVWVLLTFGTEEGQNDVVAYYRKLLEPYGVREVVEPREFGAGVKLRGDPDRTPDAVRHSFSWVVVARAARSDVDPRDGYRRAERAEDEETKITLYLIREVEKP